MSMLHHCMCVVSHNLARRSRGVLGWTASHESRGSTTQSTRPWTRSTGRASRPPPSKISGDWERKENRTVGGIEKSLTLISITKPRSRPTATVEARPTARSAPSFHGRQVQYRAQEPPCFLHQPRDDQRRASQCQPHHFQLCHQFRHCWIVCGEAPLDLC